MVLPSNNHYNNNDDDYSSDNNNNNRINIVSTDYTITHFILSGIFNKHDVYYLDVLDCITNIADKEEFLIHMDNIRIIGNEQGRNSSFFIDGDYRFNSDINVIVYILNKYNIRVR